MNKLKKTIIFAFVLMLLYINTIAIYAKDYEIENSSAKIVLDEQYVVLTPSNLYNHTDLLLEMGYTTDSFLPVVSDESINLYAVKSDTIEQIIAHTYSTNLATAIIDFTAQPAENQISIANNIVTDLTAQNYTTSTPVINTLNGVDFLTFEVTVPPDVNNPVGFTYIQYYTIINSKEIDLVFYFNAEQITDQNRNTASSIFNTLTFKNGSAIKSNNVSGLVTVLIYIGIVLLIGLVVFMIYSIIRDVRNDIKYNRPDKIDHTFRRK